MNKRYGILLMLAVAALAVNALAETAPACKATCPSSAACATASTVAWTADDDHENIRVEVEKEDGVSKVKVYEMKDGEQVLIKEYETKGDPHEMIELDGGDHDVFIMRAGDGNTWTAHHGDRGAMKKIMKIKGDDMAFFGGPRAFLGIHMSTLNEQLAEYFGAEGVLIEEVVEDSPAEEAGLKAGDVIVKMDGEDIAEAGDISEFMGDHEKGDEVKIEVRRKGKNKSFEVTLGEQEGNAFAYAFGDDDHFDIKAMPHIEHFAPHGGDSKEMENLRADIEELRAMIEELKQNK